MRKQGKPYRTPSPWRWFPGPSKGKGNSIRAQGFSCVREKSGGWRGKGAERLNTKPGSLWTVSSGLWPHTSCAQSESPEGLWELSRKWVDQGLKMGACVSTASLRSVHARHEQALPWHTKSPLGQRLLCTTPSKPHWLQAEARKGKPGSQHRTHITLQGNYQGSDHTLWQESPLREPCPTQHPEDTGKSR